ncbi:hypothetical protein Q8W41_23075 [Vibrio splendidus]|uniref:hypothetical protein n=1 Tax=Vibrio splendidus TaxID=29497 RepID=UPI0027372A49|nr:hypothetical protein [Vibrio splendidus]MDP2592375.1 hypothetical protein [Vibrio splendidus]
MKKALLLIALLASPTLASQLTEVFTDESDCSVKQVGYALKDNPVVFLANIGAENISLDVMLLSPRKSSIRISLFAI